MIDKIDKKILKELKLNSRMPIRKIAKVTKLRPSTVHARIKKLEKTRVIEQYTIRTNDKKVQENFIVLILVNTEGNIENKIFSNSCIKEVFGITGEYDLVLKCKFKDTEEFNKFILNFRNLKEVKKTLTMIGTTKIKEEI